MNANDYCIIMAGGFGSRFWPMSQTDNPKQFIDILGTGESMLQTTFNRYARIVPRENIIIVTGRPYVDRVRKQLPGLRGWQVLAEPSRRNTAPCVAYAAAVIASLNTNANIVVSPSDHAIFGTECFESDVRKALDVCRDNDWIVTMGVRPTNPNTQYGYIQYVASETRPEAQGVCRAVAFMEKPPYEMAQQFISSGEFLWNAGIFVWRLPVLMRAFRTHLPSLADTFFGLSAFSSGKELEDAYASCESVSVDYGIMEKADNVHVLEASFGWSDVETWDSLYRTYPHDADGNAIISGNVLSYDLKNCVVHVPAGRTLVLQGLEDFIVAGDETTTLVCRRDQEELIFKFASDVEMKNLTHKN